MKRSVVRCTGTALLLLVVSTASAQFFYFGRNKVQYTDFEWQVLKTEHFDIYYYPEMKDLAERGAFFAEEAFRQLEVRFNHTPGSRIPLILYSSHLHFQQTNTIGGFIPEGVGGFFEFLKGRVVIPSDGSTYAFRHVIRHELVHVFMHSKISRVLTDHRKAQDRYPPLWFVEGLAEYWSTTWDAQAEMVMRDAVLNGTMVGLSDIERFYGSFLVYKAGQNVLQYIGKVYGEEKILLLMENFWKDQAFSDVFELTIGKTYKEFDEEWLYALKKQHFPLLAANDAPSAASELLVSEGFNFKPVVDDSTGDLYYISNRTGYTGISRRRLGADPVNGEETTVIQGEKTDEFEAFHPFRSRIDISSTGQLAFVTKSGETDALHMFDTRAGTIVRTYRFPGVVAIGSATWSPDGKRLAFSAIDKGGNNDLYIVTPATGDLQRLTRDYYDDRDPAWDPRGDRLVFSSDRTMFGDSGAYNLFFYDLRTGSIEYLTCSKHSYTSPTWSRDGSRLAFTADIDGVQNIWMITFADTAAASDAGTAPPLLPVATMRRVTHFLTSAFDPAWTSEGDLVFAAFEKFSFKIRMLPRADMIADSSRIIRTVDLAMKGHPWEAQTLGGASEVERYSYKGEYSLDIAQSAISTDPVFGTVGGAFLALSDLLGDEQYYILLYNTAETQSELLSSFNLAISRISLGQRTSYAYGIYRFSGRRYDLTVKEEFYYERVYGGYLALSYPLTKFKRIETSVSLSNSTRELDLALEERRALLLSNTLSFIHDNSLWGPSGPLDGSRFNLTLAYTTDVQYSNVNYYSIIADYRHYFRLATRSAFATRLWMFYNHGKESRRFVMGGSWDLRGWPRWSIRGEKLWIASMELRFPFIDRFSVQFPFGGLSFWEIRGALFADAGGAWDDVYRETLGSVGGGLRLNLGGFLVLRYDLGKRIERNLSRFQDGIFHQFFFGWDF